MSDFFEVNLPCPNCKQTSLQKVYNTIYESDSGLINKLLNMQLNSVKCQFCNNVYLIKHKILFIDHKRKYALYYAPDENDSCVEDKKIYSRLLGAKSFLAIAKVFHNFDEFIETIRNNGLPPRKIEQITQNHFHSHSFDSNYDDYWVCDICGGDSSTGCLFYDPTECPRH